MISSGSKIQIPGRGDFGAVTLVSLLENPKGIWTLSIESGDGSQRSEILSNEEMDAVIILDDQAALTGKSPAGPSDEKVQTDNGTRRLNRRLVIMSFFGVVIVAGALIVAFRPGFINFPFGDGGSKKVVDEFSTTSEFDGRTIGEKSLGLNWKVVSGDWSIESGKLLSAQTKTSSFALLNLKSSPKSFEVDFQDATRGSGIVFLYLDDLNYWKFVAIPEMATWNLYKVENGVFEYQGNSGFAHVPEVKVTVLMSKRELKIFLDGEQRLVVPITPVSNQNSVGLVQRGLDDTSTGDHKVIIEALSLEVN
jgi:hypothetical protein